MGAQRDSSPNPNRSLPTPAPVATNKP
jgi:hypothetical protein